MLAAGRLVALLAGVGGGALLLFFAGVALRRASAVFLAVAACAAEYGAFLGLQGTTVDRWAPLVAAALLLAAELGSRAAERSQPAPERAVVIRTLLWLLASTAAATALGAGLLAAAGAATGGLRLEAVGIAAAIVAVATPVALVARTRDSSGGRG